MTPTNYLFCLMSTHDLGIPSLHPCRYYLENTLDHSLQRGGLRSDLLS
jgi:hypothetical protein